MITRARGRSPPRRPARPADHEPRRLPRAAGLFACASGGRRRGPQGAEKLARKRVLARAAGGRGSRGSKTRRVGRPAARREGRAGRAERQGLARGGGPRGLAGALRQVRRPRAGPDLAKVRGSWPSAVLFQQKCAALGPRGAPSPPSDPLAAAKPQVANRHVFASRRREPSPHGRNAHFCPIGAARFQEKRTFAVFRRPAAHKDDTSQEKAS